MSSNICLGLFQNVKPPWKRFPCTSGTRGFCVDFTLWGAVQTAGGPVGVWAPWDLGPGSGEVSPPARTGWDAEMMQPEEGTDGGSSGRLLLPPPPQPKERGLMSETDAACQLKPWFGEPLGDCKWPAIGRSSTYRTGGPGDCQVRTCFRFAACLPATLPRLAER